MAQTNTDELPRIISFGRIGSDEKGYLVPFEHIPFPIAHSYCIGPVPAQITRGNHAKKLNKQVLVAIGGKAELWLESPSGEHFHFFLDKNSEGLYIPNGYWRKARLDEGCFLLGLHSRVYDEQDYIRDYEEFKRFFGRL